MDSCLFLLLRVVWFVCIGLPVGWFFILLGWACCVTIIGIPLGIMIFNRLPMIMTLQPDLEDRYRLSMTENEVFRGRVVQWPLIFRLLYLVCIGWWFSFFWVQVAFFLSASVIGIPIGFWMFNRFPFVLFLTQV